MTHETPHDFTNRVAVVTGGAQGIGLALVQRRLAAGARVAFRDSDVAEMARCG